MTPRDQTHRNPVAAMCAAENASPHSTVHATPEPMFATHKKASSDRITVSLVLDMRKLTRSPAVYRVTHAVIALGMLFYTR